jgi:hypothetical protein
MEFKEGRFLRENPESGGKLDSRLRGHNGFHLPGASKFRHSHAGGNPEGGGKPETRLRGHDVFSSLAFSKSP